MSDRGSFRSRGGGPSRGGRGGRGGGGHHNKDGGDGGQQKERPKKEAILDLNKYNDKRIMVKFNGGREGMNFSPSSIPPSPQPSPSLFEKKKEKPSYPD